MIPTPPPSIADDEALATRIGRLGDQLHNLGCACQNDESLSDELARLAARAWQLSAEARGQ